MAERCEQTTRLLARLRAGDAAAEGELLACVYDELHRIAGGYLRGAAGSHTLQPTALVNEAWLRLAGGAPGDFSGRAHFVGVAAKAMRSALVDHERKKRAARRGEARPALPLEAVAETLASRVPDLLALDEALERFAELDPQAARLVELRFFAGLSHEEAGAVLGVSERTARRLWSAARLWLRRELGPGPDVAADE